MVALPFLVVILPKKAARWKDGRVAVLGFRDAPRCRQCVSVVVLVLVRAGGDQHVVRVDEVGHELELGKIVIPLPLPLAGVQVQRNEFLMGKLPDGLNCAGLGSRLLCGALDKIDHVLTDGDRGVDDRPSTVFPSGFTSGGVHAEQPVTGDSADVTRLEILKPLTVVAKIECPLVHATAHKRRTLHCEE